MICSQSYIIPILGELDSYYSRVQVETGDEGEGSVGEVRYYVMLLRKTLIIRVRQLGFLLQSESC